jgi:DNA-binding transcriptional MerR regulator
MDWSRHDPIPAEWYGRGRVAELAGVQPVALTNWQKSGAVSFVSTGKGITRRYSIWDVLHLAIIAELHRMGVQTSGTGALLSESLTAFVRWHLKRDGDLSRVPHALAVYATGDRDWYFSAALAPACSHFVVNLRSVVDAIEDRHALESHAKTNELKQSVRASA